MLRRPALSGMLVAPLAAMAALGLLSSLAQGGAGRGIHEASAACYGERDRAWTTDMLRDWTSFSDQLSIIRVTSDAAVPVDRGPTSGYIGRTVEIRVERTMWRRRGAPSAPKRFRQADWGWCQTPEGRLPFLVDTVTRLRPGRRYLAPLTRYRGWGALSDARLRLRGGRVMGGVDSGDPTFAHQDLLGLTLPAAVSLVRRATPYRAAIRLAHENPVRRWNAADSDAYRVGSRGLAPRVTVAMGVTRASRWRLYAWRVGSARICMGLYARPLDRLAAASRRESCGGAPARGRVVPGRYVVTPRGAFAYGAAWDTAVEVEVGFMSGASVRSATYTSQHGLPGRNRFWILPLDGSSRPLSVRALDRGGQSLGAAEIR